MENTEKLTGIVDRITFHNEENGWSVLKVSSFKNPASPETVLIHQAKVLPGATMEFWGNWTSHPKYGQQFKAKSCVEKKPASTAALEKYLGSGLIKGVGPKTAKKIVNYFKEETLDIFDHQINRLTDVPGIAEKMLKKIQASWIEHKEIQEVMMFLQGHGLSSLLAVKIYRHYGDRSISLIKTNPYILAKDIYGIGFFTADKIALNIGFATDSKVRLEGGVKHCLLASQESGHCYLTQTQIINETLKLLNLSSSHQEYIVETLFELKEKEEVKTRILENEECFYSKSLYYAELGVSEHIKRLLEANKTVDEKRIKTWVERYCESQNIHLSHEQSHAVEQAPKYSFSILTGGPGCGKTTTTKVLVKLLMAMQKKVLLAAPTGRAAQRMSEVIGHEAKTIHRLLGWNPSQGGFEHNQDNPLICDFLILDETSMLDITLTNKLLAAVHATTQVLFIGDPDQLPAVGAGNVLRDLINSPLVKTFKLTEVFRQAQTSKIISAAHEINKGQSPKLISLLKNPQAFKQGVDFLFLDSEEANQDQLRFLSKIKNIKESSTDSESFDIENLKDQITIPDKLKHVNVEELMQTKNYHEQLRHIIKSVHPDSTLYHGLSAQEALLRLYLKTIPEYLGKKAEIQILSPQTKGSLGTLALNEKIQLNHNPPSPGKKQLKMGERIYRVGDRVIQTRNNYDLGVFNGDIGKIIDANLIDLTLDVAFEGDRIVQFSQSDLNELKLAYAITIHKSQGSEFEAVIIPVLSQHYTMLFKNLIYTGITRAKKLVILVGSRKSLAMAIRREEPLLRQTALKELLKS